MSKQTVLAIDNGTTGSIAVIGPNGTMFDEVPIRTHLMGKAGKLIKRIDHGKLDDIVESAFQEANGNMHAYVERPFTGSAMMINITTLAARAHEAVLIVLEQAGVGYTVVDSKEWQKAVLGQIKGSAALKLASKLRGIQQYPVHAAAIEDHGDADALMIAQYYYGRA